MFILAVFYDCTYRQFLFSFAESEVIQKETIQLLTDAGLYKILIEFAMVCFLFAFY